MRNKNTAERILLSYNNRVAWGKGDADEALIDAINHVYPFRTEEQKADLFSQIMEHWAEYRGAVPRKLYLSTVLTRWDRQCVRGEL